MTGIQSLVDCPEGVLNAAPSSLFERIAKLASTLENRTLAVAIEGVWIGRLHAGQLSPIPAIVFGKSIGHQLLTSHAMYAQMIRVGPSLSPGDRFQDAELSPLMQLHVCCGYFSLQTCWKRLRKSAPSFAKSKTCSNHHQCMAAWKEWWRMAVDSPMLPFSPAAVLERLGVLIKMLRADPALSNLMTGQCRSRALASVQKKQNDVASNLPHHFDL